MPHTLLQASAYILNCVLATECEDICFKTFVCNAIKASTPPFVMLLTCLAFKPTSSQSQLLLRQTRRSRIMRGASYMPACTRVCALRTSRYLSGGFDLHYTHLSSSFRSQSFEVGSLSRSLVFLALDVSRFLPDSTPPQFYPLNTREPNTKEILFLMREGKYELRANIT